MNKEKAVTDILSHALKLVPFEGWNQPMLNRAAIAAGYKKIDVIRVFPGGAIDAVECFLQHADEMMLESLKNYHFDTMKIRERIATAVRVKLIALEPHREALRKALAVQALPFFCHRALRSLYRTVDTIWYGAGDNSTDFNFYTKRLLLAGVYSSTLIYWLDDKSMGKENTWAFLDRRIENVMKIEKAKQRFKQWFAA